MELRSYKDDDDQEHDNRDDQDLLDHPPKPRQRYWPPSKRTRYIALGVAVILLLLMSSSAWQHWKTRTSHTIANNTKLRILPLGDSITEGYMSSDGNGYRLPLLNLLKQNESNEIELVGSLESGNMSQNRHCGFGGWTIAQISTRVGECVASKPNIILLHAGTNDLNNDPPDEPYHDAPYRLVSLMESIHELLPDTPIVLAQITQSTTKATSRRIAVLNEMIPIIVEEKGGRVLVVDMSSIGGNASTSADGLHPNDAGYTMMAKVWEEGIKEAGVRGWIHDLETV